MQVVQSSSIMQMQCSRSLHCFAASIIIITIIILSISSSANAIQAGDIINRMEPANSYIDREHRHRQRQRRKMKNNNRKHSQQLSSGDVRNKYNINDSFIEENKEATDNIIYSKAKNDDDGRSLKNMFLPEPRIINGQSAPERRYPYAASLQYNRQHFCGGSLVAPNIVITAAHCTTTPTKITLGRYDLDDEMDFDYEIMGVTEKIIHPQYDKTVVENDLALLILERDSVHPWIKINADGNAPVSGDELAVMGWGDIDPSDYGQKTSDELRETDVWYMTNRECEDSEGYVKTSEGVLFGSYQGSITNSMMCALDYIGTTSDACQGDSGGALVKPGTDYGTDTLVGIVSWGFGCADPNFPGVYSRLSAYYDDFLKPNICKYSRKPPAYLNCNPGTQIVPVATPAPVPTPDGLITIFIDTDPFSPEDLGWEITSIPDGKVVASRPVGYYAGKYRTTTSEEVIVETEKFYRMTIQDRDRDGFRGEMTVVRGRKNVKSDALVYEPGFSSVSGSSVVHGFYVGDSPPSMLTLDLAFDAHPDELAWSVTNVEDDLPLGFKWFDWYSTNFIKAVEEIPIYGPERGRQKYLFTVLDLDGDGMCCSQGQGSYSLYIGDSNTGSLIATGGKFTTDQSYMFEVDAAGRVSSPGASSQPIKQPTPPAASAGFYMAPSTGICQANDESKPDWITQIFSDYDECCQFSWNNQGCLNAKPFEESAPSQPSPEVPVPTPAVGNPNQPYPTAPILITSPVGTSNGNGLTFTPVTGSFTCPTAGMACVVKCTECDTIKRIASGMTVDATEGADESTFVYIAERGTDFFPYDPSRLILVESDISAASVISCDAGCTCSKVNDNALGCGMIANPTDAQPVAPSPSSPTTDDGNGSVHRNLPLLVTPCILLLSWMFAR